MRVLKWLWIAMLCVAATARGAELSGTVALNGKGVGRNVVVVLEGAKKAEPLTKAVIDQRNKMFLPHVAVVTVGTTVEFPNNDSVFHNVFAYFNAKKFDLGMYPRGATKKVTFDKPGVVAILCNVHSEMSAYLYITESPYYTIADKQGRFRLRDVPPGTYTLRAWHETGATFTQSITLKADNPEMALTLKK
jgi:plastocyanin